MSSTIIGSFVGYGDRKLFNYVKAKISLEDFKGVEIVGEGCEVVGSENCMLTNCEKFDVVK